MLVQIRGLDFYLLIKLCLEDKTKKMSETEGIVDILKDGIRAEKMIYLEVGGKRIGSIHLGSRNNIGNSYRVLINIEPVYHDSGYKIKEAKSHLGGTNAHIELIRTEEEKKK